MKNKIHPFVLGFMSAYIFIGILILFMFMYMKSTYWGIYHDDLGTITIFTKDNPNILFTAYHEYGHYQFMSYNKNVQQQFCDIYNISNINDCNEEYARRTPYYYRTAINLNILDNTELEMRLENEKEN